MPPYGQADEVRELVGNPPDSEVGEDQISTAIEDADKIIDMETGRTWLTTDAEFSIVEGASNYYAASVILDHSKEIDQAKWFMERFNSMIERLKRASVVSQPNESVFLKTAGPEDPTA